MVGTMLWMPDRVHPRRKPRLYLAEWRQARDLTQQAVADRLGVSSVTISRWETGERRPDLNAQAAFAEALGRPLIEMVDLYRHPDTVSADELLRGQPPEIIEQAIRIIKAIRR
jgi:transcriptional regulator with XRE-family HTH domain